MPRKPRPSREAVEHLIDAMFDTATAANAGRSTAAIHFTAVATYRHAGYAPHVTSKASDDTYDEEDDYPDVVVTDPLLKVAGGTLRQTWRAWAANGRRD